MSSNIPFSVLDLSPIVQGGNASQAFANSLDLARHVERRGFHRFWLAEHHNFPGIASAATSVLIGHIAGGTSSIRVGSGGIMLPNHAPLVIAEQFGTLESLYPGRIDLGLGRAPGTDQITMRALRRDFANKADSFPEDLLELQSYFDPGPQPRPVRAVPGSGLRVPIWLLGSSLFSAQLSARLGLPFAFAAHFAPDYLLQALELYHQLFQPSKVLDAPYAMICINVFAADTDVEAQRIATSAQQQFLNLRRGVPGQLQPPVDSMEGRWSETEKAGVEHALRYSAIGSPATVARRLDELVELTAPNEVMIAGHIYDHRARLHSFDIVADVRNLQAPRATEPSP